MSSYEYFRSADRLSAAAAASFCLAADSAVYGAGNGPANGRCGSAVALTSSGSSGPTAADLYYGANGTSGRSSSGGGGAYLQQSPPNYQPNSVDFKSRGATIADMASFRAAGFPDYTRSYSDGYGTPVPVQQQQQQQQPQLQSTPAAAGGGLRCSPPSPNCLKPLGVNGGPGLRQADDGSSGALSPPLSDSSSIDGDSGGSVGSGVEDYGPEDVHGGSLQNRTNSHHQLQVLATEHIVNFLRRFKFP